MQMGIRWPMPIQAIDAMAKVIGLGSIGTIHDPLRLWRLLVITSFEAE